MQLEDIQSNQFDLKKLIQLCRELDFCFRNECHLAVAALTRALLDHVPPIFGKQNFGEIANNYAGTKSFRESMQHLENSARSIGDAHFMCGFGSMNRYQLQLK
jgi:methylphosphotriester-DNA--protein-cysteine methyltransferase